MKGEFKNFKLIEKVLKPWIFRKSWRMIKGKTLLSAFHKSIQLRERISQEIKIPIPFAMFISLTNDCNLSCKTCFNRHYESKQSLKMEFFLKAMEEARNLGVFFFVLTGGEPFLREDLITLLKKNQEVLFLIFTNGTLLNSDLANKLRKFVNVLLYVSLDGSTKENDFLRGEGAFEKIERAYLILQERDLLYGFSTILTKINYMAVLSREYLNWLEGIGVKYGIFIEYFSHRRNENIPLELDLREREIIKEKFLKLKKGSKIPLSLFPDDEYKFGGCLSAGQGILSLNATGYFEPCPFIHYEKCHISNTTILEALKSDYFQSIRQKTKRLGEVSCILKSQGFVVDKEKGLPLLSF